MAAKQERYKKLPPLKRKKVTPTASGVSNNAEPKSRLKKAEVILDQETAAYKLANRATKDFSREELGALMQTAPGGAEPHQIKTQSRQFNRVADQMPEAIVADKRVSPGEDLRVKKPMSAKTPKIDLND
jgi:hypothetical protein